MARVPGSSQVADEFVAALAIVGYQWRGTDATLPKPWIVSWGTFERLPEFSGPDGADVTRAKG